MASGCSLTTSGASSVSRSNVMSSHRIHDGISWHIGTNKSVREDMEDIIYDHVCSIWDPEHSDTTLGDLDVIYREGIHVCNSYCNICSNAKEKSPNNYLRILVTYRPTVPHCSMGSIIALSIRQKIIHTQNYWLTPRIREYMRSINASSDTYSMDYKIEVRVERHNNSDEINKQINDKERVAAALENPNIKTVVYDIIQEEITD